MGCAASGSAPPAAVDKPAGTASNEANVGADNGMDPSKGRSSKRSSKKESKKESKMMDSFKADEAEDPPYQLPAEKTGVSKVVILVDSFLMLEAEVEIFKDEKSEGAQKLKDGLKKLFAGKSRTPNSLLLKGVVVPLNTPPAKLYDMVTHGTEYEVCFITG